MLASVTCDNKDAVLTDRTWQCADEPNNNWHDPSSMGQNVLTESDVVKERLLRGLVVHWKQAEIPKQLHKGKPGKHGAYIWAGASECILDQDGNEACVPPLSVFCRKVINTETLASRPAPAPQPPSEDAGGSGGSGGGGGGISVEAALLVVVVLLLLLLLAVVVMAVENPSSSQNAAREPSFGV
jgi:hypothetical protein